MGYIKVRFKMRNTLKIVFAVLSIALMPMLALAQNDTDNSLNQRTPEQEATKQTEKFQSELNLTPEQTKAVYQINLRYAQARKNVSRRSDAMEIIKNKDESLRKVLTQDQYTQLESKRTSYQQVEGSESTQRLRTNPTLRSSYSSREDERRRANVRNNEPSQQRNESSRNVRTNYTRPSSARQTTPPTRTNGSRSAEPTRNTNSRSSSASEERSSGTRSSSSNSGSRR